MGRLAYLEPIGGASGNMLLGAALHSGWPLARLQDCLGRLGLNGWQLQHQHRTVHGLSCLHMDFEVQDQTDHRHLSDIHELLAAGQLPAPVRENAERVFHRLAEAEAAVHGVGLDEVHFHEVGALDSILDVVGFCSWMHDEEIHALHCAPLPYGRGVIVCQHGVFPNPAPATVELLRGVPQRAVELEAEMVTPTAAALLSTLARFEAPPPGAFERVGYGAGTREFAIPNVIRLQLSGCLHARA